MDFEKFINALHKEIGTETQRELAKKLGITEAELCRWKKSGVTERTLAKALVKASQVAVRDAKHHMIKPIVEFYPIDAVDSQQGVKYELFPSKHTHEASTFQTGLRKSLEKAKGIYIFYDSRGAVLYAGKAARQSLWREMKDAFNRDRAIQTVTRAEFPKRNQEFTPSYEKDRKLTRIQLRLSDMAAYFSVYEVDVEMIDELETLLIRGFANDVLNVRMETFGRLRRSQ